MTTDRPPPTRDDTATAVRHLRFNVAEWRRAATRANREGRGIAEVAGAFLRAYGAGELDAPVIVGPPCPECGQSPAMHTAAGRSGPNRYCDPAPTTMSKPAPKGDA